MGKILEFKRKPKEKKLYGSPTGLVLKDNDFKGYTYDAERLESMIRFIKKANDRVKRNMKLGEDYE